MAIERTSLPVIVAILAITIHIAAVTLNISAYRDALHRIERTVSSLQRNQETSLAAVKLIGVPPSANGVVFYGAELEYRVKEALPSTVVKSCSSTLECSVDASEVAAYHWDDRSQDLVLDQQP